VADRLATGGFPISHSNGHANGTDRSSAKAASATSLSGAQLRAPQPQGHAWNGPIQIGKGRMAEQMVQVAYNAQHYVPWHWPVPAYLVTKGIGAGIFMMLSLVWGLNILPFDGLTAVVGGFLSLLFIVITTGLLVWDLEKPEMFLTILTRPQWRSWLTRGAFILIGFSAVAGVWWLWETIAYFGGTEMPGAMRILFMWVGFALAVLSAIYTAFLFGQAEGRDLWQSTLLPFHLVVQAFMVGSAVLLLFDLVLSFPDALTNILLIALASTLVVDLFVTLAGELGMPHASEAAAKAAHDISQGKYRDHFWKGSITLGHAVPLVLMMIAFLAPTSAPLFAAAAGLCSIAGLYAFEYAFVMAPQDISNS
jgi:formate-dependent nitrite reductase membrane component NrfD